MPAEDRPQIGAVLRAGWVCALPFAALIWALSSCPIVNRRPRDWLHLPSPWWWVWYCPRPDRPCARLIGAIAKGGAIFAQMVVITAQALSRLGIEPIAGHLFVLYFGMMSMIAPPVAIAAFAAAALADAGPMRTAVAAIRWLAGVRLTLCIRVQHSPPALGDAVRCTYSCNSYRIRGDSGDRFFCRLFY
ncbi:TRAP transporter large permease subunit [Sulfitobacter sp. NFXS29]|uniref:TRAP transporter large permease subunit n=1 Tax=Sulfitobacter sp. NFXS29 TaxID=2818438 RepID=UPI0032DFB718